ncbi:hypothetical protein FHS18_006578 [Paenibacillus phyllosphaerae]|uniref:SLH domain-containing protein n=1 Tax=Paenibacillus phyllosphaerae TaxID=274593 RepID=A0A7W5B4W0_9BACL|nr:S-layer homology domain-containing protein [Paenibacillus phyllosphaerae]MBB3114457.1 hypothetical protein [Paenibacillus phyllosphaerae]
MKKKLLSLGVASLLGLSGVVGIANAAKTTADFDDLKSLDQATKAKFDAMIQAGIFNGVSEGHFGLQEEMNRAQFAKVSALIMGLEIDTKLETSSFKDVVSDDPGFGYALPFIEALKNAGVTEGVGDGTFNPSGTVTKEQLATFLVRVVDKDSEVDKNTQSDDPTVSNWAKGYVELALELKLLPSVEDGTFGGKTNATRELLVLGSYESKQIIDAEQAATEEPEPTEPTQPSVPTTPAEPTPTPSTGGGTQTNPGASTDPNAGANPDTSTDPNAGANPDTSTDPNAESNPGTSIDPNPPLTSGQ